MQTENNALFDFDYETMPLDRLQRLLVREQRLAGGPHWTYSPARHIGMWAIYQRRRLKELAVAPPIAGLSGATTQEEGNTA